MIKIVTCLASSITLCLCLNTNIQAMETPKGIAGIKLKSAASSYTPALAMATYVKEKYVQTQEPFRKISILSGNCKRKGQVLKIKAKYQDKTKEFYNKIHHQLAEKYDSKGQWEGDAFGIFSSWKWSFTDEDGNRIIMAIEHNSKDTELSMGSVLKMSYPILIEEERLCGLQGVTKKKIYNPDVNDIKWQQYLPE